MRHSLGLNIVALCLDLSLDGTRSLHSTNPFARFSRSPPTLCSFNFSTRWILTSSEILAGRLCWLSGVDGSLAGSRQLRST